MKRTLLLFILTPILMISCSKSKDGVVINKTELPTRVELDLPTLNSYIGQKFDDVHKTLEKNAFNIKNSLGDRYFDIAVNSGIHDGLTVELKETGKVISQINVKYDGVVGGDSIGDPYENELWYYMLQKVQGLYGQSSTRIYIQGVTSRLASSNDALVQLVKDNGYSGASYAATWNGTTNVITVFHSDSGRFLLQIKAK